PVLMQPLRYQWDTAQLEAAPIRERYDNARTGRAKTNARVQLLAKRAAMLKGIRETTVLDPACGSGNFLYIALQALMDLEKEVIQHPLWAGLQMAAREVHPRQMYGIEINPIAQALASIVVWIGYIQWRINNGYGQEFGEPILEELEDNIVRKDAILPPAMDDDCRGVSLTRPNDDGLETGVSAKRPYTESARGVDWPAVDVIVGNPPFLGGQRMRNELGNEYYERLTDFYQGRVPGGADLVCYWYEVAREQIENGKAKRAGLLATNSIRGGLNRHVLNRIKQTGDIFMAWSDNEWILNGAAVRVSMVGFDKSLQSDKMLDGLPVENINADLTGSINIINASSLQENRNISFQGPVKVGAFDIENELAHQMLSASNISGVENSAVIKPYRNGNDLVKRNRNFWIIDFQDMEIKEARKYEAPFQYVEDNIKPVRANNNNRKRRENWWKLGASGRQYREAIVSITRQIFSPRVAKHRVFVWDEANVFPGDAIVAIARDDDYFFGVLHSKLHETWSLRMGTWLGKGNDPRYTPTTTFETFPFPWPPGAEDKSCAAHAAISAAAAQLHEERHAWLNPADDSRRGDSVSRPPPAPLKDRTLTNLYNALQVFRGRDSMKVKPAAADFAPRLDELHRALDEAVCDAYGWGYAVLGDEEEILRRLLALNLARAAQSD
ncbi:MAG: class I SAM-dependent DNA methyltransferase, partial [Chloroflexi bacterium]|nr:class I SAM-dependent DNA methyltransferase [Chloroflexota bacterium]